MPEVDETRIEETVPLGSAGEVTLRQVRDRLEISLSGKILALDAAAVDVLIDALQRRRGSL